MPTRNKETMDGFSNSSYVRKTESLRLQVLETNVDNSLVCIKQSLLSSQASATSCDEIIRVLLCGVWTQSRLTPNCTIHLIDPWYDLKTDRYVIDNQNGLLVIEPDNMYTCTLIASSLFCERKSWLNNIFLGPVGSNRAMMVGTLTHEVFQYGVRSKIVDLNKLTKFLDELLDDATIMLEIYSADATLKDVRDETIRYIPSVIEWIEKYMLSGPPSALTNEPDIGVKVTKVVDIEENVWSTKYGLKGKIDVTGLVKVHDGKSGSVDEKIIPLELKTGNPNLSSSHAAQVSLYSMMVEDRYAKTNQGFVIYLKEKAAMHNVGLTTNTKRDLINRRNAVNHFMKDYSKGPEMLNQSRVCRNCERLTECLLMSKMYNPNMIDEYKTMKMLQSEATGHLDERFIKFFKRHHEKLVHLITKPGVPLGGEHLVGISPTPAATGTFWTRSSDESEAAGIGFGKLQATRKGDDKKCIIFKRHPKHEANYVIKAPTTANDKHTIIQLGDQQETSQKTKKMKIEDYFKPKAMEEHVKREVRVCKPFRTDLSYHRTRFAISLDHENEDLDALNSSTAIAIGFINELKPDSFEIKIFEGSIDTKRSEELMFRVDKLEKRVNFDIQRIVLIRLLENTLPIETTPPPPPATQANGTDKQTTKTSKSQGDAANNNTCDNIRRLLTDPLYKPVDDMNLNIYLLSDCYDEISNFDAVEQKSIIGAVATQNYYILNERVQPNRLKINPLIVTIVSLIRKSLDKSVIIVAKQIDSMIDLMRSLRRKKISFSLVDDGSSTKARYEFSSELIKVPNSSSLSLETKYDMYIRAHESAKIIFTTFSMSIGGLQFSKRRFDYSIAYDCHDIELLTGLAPMFISNKHIFIDIACSEPHETTDTTSIAHKELTLGQHLRDMIAERGDR